MPNSYRFALKDMFTSPRCKVCFDKLNVSADIVLGDPWGMSDVDWNHGASLLITRTCKGEKLISDMQQAGCLSLTHRPLDELLKGQHVDDRKRQVAVFSRALSALPFKTDSYLYSQEATRRVDEKAVEKAKEEFTAFVGREKKSKEEIVLEARGRIKSHCRRMRLQRNIIYRILRKLKNIIIR